MADVVQDKMLQNVIYKKVFLLSSCETEFITKTPERQPLKNTDIHKESQCLTCTTARTSGSEFCVGGTGGRRQKR